MDPHTTLESAKQWWRHAMIQSEWLSVCSSLRWPYQGNSLRALWSTKFICSLLSFPVSYSTSKKTKLAHRSTALIGDTEWSLAFWPFSCLKATLLGSFGHVKVVILLHDNLMCLEKEETGGSSNYKHGDPVRRLPCPLVWLQAAYPLNQVQVAGFPWRADGRKMTLSREFSRMFARKNNANLGTVRSSSSKSNPDNLIYPQCLIVPNSVEVLVGNRASITSINSKVFKLWGGNANRFAVPTGDRSHSVIQGYLDVTHCKFLPDFISPRYLLLTAILDMTKKWMLVLILSTMENNLEWVRVSE